MKQTRSRACMCICTWTHLLPFRSRQWHEPLVFDEPTEHIQRRLERTTHRARDYQLNVLCERQTLLHVSPQQPALLNAEVRQFWIGQAVVSCTATVSVLGQYTGRARNIMNVGMRSVIEVKKGKGGDVLVTLCFASACRSKMTVGAIAYTGLMIG